MQIDASGGFDRYPTGRNLVILGLPLAVQLRGEVLVVRVRHRLWGGCRCLTRGALNVEISAKIPLPDFYAISAKVPTGLDCAGLI